MTVQILNRLFMAAGLSAMVVFGASRFRRGYEDGYGSRHQDGKLANGKAAILAEVMAGIITYEAIR
jgi:hypothetical protein